ncbi:MAG: hypothetical protein WD830_03625 [Chloroflexota bacterium]
MRDARSGLVVATIVLAVIGCGAPAPSAAPSGAPATDSSSQPITPATAPAPGATVGSGATGALPTPAPGPVATLPPLPDSADLTELPVPAALPEGVPQQQAEALVASLADATTTAERLPLVMTVLLASGIPILDENGARVPFDPPPSGPAMEAWEVHALAATDPSRHARITYRDFADLFPGTSDPDAFVGAFSLDLRTAAFGADPAGQRWAFLVAARDPLGAIQAMAAGETDNMFFDGLQIQLVLHRLAVDLWRESLDQPSGHSITLAAYRLPGSGPAGVSQAPLPCRHTDTEDKIVTVAEEGGSAAMGEVIGYLDDKGLAGMGALAKIGMAADIASFILPYLLLTIDFELSAPPLVRTKSTSTHGERRQLAATLRFDTGNLQLVNCFRLMFASMGMSFSLPQDGPLGNGSVSWVPYGGFERVQFYGDPVHTRSDDRGIAIIGVEGRKQKNELAPTAGRVNTEASVLLTYRIKEQSLGGDLWDAASSAGSPLNILLESLARAKWSSAGFTFPVVDWGERWQVEIVIEETSEGGSLYFQWQGVLGVDSEGIIVGEGVGAVTIIGKLCVDIGPDRHTEHVDWRMDGNFPFNFEGNKRNGVLHMLLPPGRMQFRTTGNPGPCKFDSAFKQAGAQALVAQLANYPIQLAARAGTQSVPFGDQTTLTIRMEPVSD